MCAAAHVFVLLYNNIEMDLPLTFQEIVLISKKQLVLLLSTEIKNLSLRQIFQKSNYVVINYLSSKNFGHWVALYNDQKNNTINFFDSYGGFPDSQLKYIPKEFKMVSHQDYPYLLRKLYEYDGTVEYNYKVLQSLDTNTCGRWVGLYLKVCNQISIDDFGTIIETLAKKTEIPNDKLIIKLTEFN